MCLKSGCQGMMAAILEIDLDHVKYGKLRIISRTTGKDFTFLTVELGKTE